VAFNALLRDRVLLCILLSILVLSAAGGIVNVALAALASKLALLQSFTDRYSLIVLLIGIGSASASLLILRGVITEKNVDKHSVIGIVGLALYPLSIASLFSGGDVGFEQLIAFVALSILNGWGNSVVIVALTTKLQQNSPKSHVAKIVTLTSIIGSVVATMTTLVTGAFPRKLITLLIGSFILMTILMPLYNKASKVTSRYE
jgi:uncharacterized membrane protein